MLKVNVELLITFPPKIVLGAFVAKVDRDRRPCHLVNTSKDVLLFAAADCSRQLRVPNFRPPQLLFLWGTGTLSNTMLLVPCQMAYHSFHGL